MTRMKIVGADGDVPTEERPRELGLFVDPGSIETGWCVAKPTPDFGLSVIAAGTIKRPKGMSPLLRIDGIRCDMMSLMNKLHPDLGDFVVEVTSGKVNRARHGGGGAGLGVHGMAVGTLWTMGLMWRPAGGAGPTVTPVPENVWKAGFGKLKSAHVAKRYFEQYDPSTDPEFNIADAVALAVWYYTLWMRKRAEKSGGGR